MNWISWVLPVLIALPLIGGVLAGILTSDRVRYTLVTVLAVLIAAGGIGVVYLSTLCDNGVWTMQAAPWMAYVGFGLEVAIIAVILIVALKIKNAWIALLSVLQLVGVGVTFFLHGDHSSSFELFRIDNLTRIMLLVSCCVGAAILVFSIGYMTRHKEHAPPEAGSLQRFYFFFLSFLLSHFRTN